MVTSSASSTQSYDSTQSASLWFNPSTCKLEQEQEQVENCEVEHSFQDSNTTWMNKNHEHIRECVTAGHNSTCESEQEQVKNCKVEYCVPDRNTARTNENHEHIRECVTARHNSTCESEQEQFKNCKVEHSFEDSNTAWTNENHKHIRKCVTAGHNSTCEPEQKQVKKCKVKHSFEDSNATWMNENGELQSIGCLCLDIDIDTLTTNKAMFKLSCQVFLKKSHSNKTSIYLFILPPISTVTLENDKGRVSLRFCMDQFKQNALLVVPSSGDGPLILRRRSEQHLNLLQALSLVKNFTIQLGNTEISESTKLELDHVASVFSPYNPTPPKPINPNLNSLYIGKGGEIVNAVTTATSISSEAGPPPPYQSSKRKKRKYSSRGEFESSIEASLDGITSNVKSNSRETLKSSMEARLARMEARLADTETSLADTKARLVNTEARLEMVINWVKKMEKKFMSDLKAVRAQYGERTRKRFNLLLEQFLNSTRLDDAIDGRLEDRIDDLRTEILELFGDKERDFEKGLEELFENKFSEVREFFEDKLSGVEETFGMKLEECVADTTWEVRFHKK